ncbi:DUF1223 domain-containing protein [Sungkyunkwania multivorans]|uniref:DUF1223 domain-containing protein n=1 Tax=Sungkyunkwania multivorans TaxID=1173618 RepID=A0ABW3CZ52_9FLAO
MRKVLLTFLMAIVVAMMSASHLIPNNKSDNFDPMVVLELFTSQGCSSCPPADALLDEVAERYEKEDVFVLSYHVDYWNYIGWQDPYSKASYTEKQRRYGQKFHASSIYTPQLVVNGKEHFVGSDRKKLLPRIEAYMAIPSENRIDILSAEKNGDELSMSYKVRGELSDKKIRTVLVIKERTTDIKRGENRNRKLKNTHIVVAESYEPVRPSGTSRIAMPTMVKENDELQLIVLIEDSELTITGASKLNL